MARTWEPRTYPVRKPADTAQGIGRMVNPPRALKMGGKGEQRLFNPHTAQPGTYNTPNAVGPVTDRGKGGKR